MERLMIEELQNELIEMRKKVELELCALRAPEYFAGLNDCEKKTTS